ncbi:MAG: zinc-binding protein [Phycisphaeraceae bacterium]|nr:zinc-binding protein [Phycisphaeraceae bacterium]
MSNGESCCCGKSGDQGQKKILFYACSGGANVAEASDSACRQLMSDGMGAMFCLAGLGAGIQSMVDHASDADLNIVIDGCPMDCARKIFEKSGLENVHYARATDMGLEKKPKGTRATEVEINTIIDHVKQFIATV